MIGLVFTGHIEFASGIKSALVAIAGSTEQMEFVTFPETINCEQLEKNLAEAAKRVDTGDGVLFFTDLIGGTPNNMCVKIIMQNPDKKYECICGVNLPLALTASMEREDYDDIQQLVEELIKPSSIAVKNVKKEIKACSIVDGHLDCSDDGI